MARKRYSDENELRGDGGYQGVSANQFSYSSGSKAVTPARDPWAGGAVAMLMRLGS